MSLAGFSIRRPVFVSCLFLAILALGILAYGRLSTELYPDVSFPVVNVTIPFPGAGPEEVETQVSRPLEDALSGVASVRLIRSTSLQGAGVVTTVFNLNTDTRVAEQDVARALARVRGDLPSGALEPTIRTIDPSDVPIMTLALTADLPAGRLYRLADREVRPRIERVPQVGLVELQGGRKREIQVGLDRGKLAALEMTAGEVVNSLGQAGINIPSGQIADPRRDTLVRSVGQFDSLAAIRKTPIRFVGNEAVTTLEEVGHVDEGLSDEVTRAYVDGRRALLLQVYRQRGADSLAIADSIRKQVEELGAELGPALKGFELSVVHDGTRPIRNGVQEAKLAIQVGVLLTIVVVFFFLGNLRSTLITGVALPNSLLGAFLLMWVAGFSVNITTLAALSLAVGLLIDDAIVVRESIFRRIEKGEPPEQAAVHGTNAVALAVVATTLTVLSVFGPVAFLRGIIGQFFKEFGLTICFAMLISLLDSLTVAPMLSAYFAGKRHGQPARTRSRGRGWLQAFERFQQWQERVYLKALGASLRRPLLVLGLAAAVFGLSFAVFARIPKSFVPPAGAGEFEVSLDASPGTSLEATDRLASAVDRRIRSHPEVETTVLRVGGEHGEHNQAHVLVLLKESRKRSRSTDEMKEMVRQELKRFPQLTSAVQDIVEIGGGAGQPFVLNITGQELGALKKASEDLMAQLAKEADLRDIRSSYQAGASELQVRIDPRRAEELGVSAAGVGQELRLLLTGISPARYREAGEQYDIHVRLKEDQRDFRESFNRILVPNLNHRLVPLRSVADRVDTDSPSQILRENRKRFIQISADTDPKGRGLAHAIQVARSLLDSGRVRLPPGIGYEFAGQTRDFQDLLSSALLAVGLSVGFMYLVLACLYESFFIPIAIMLVLPLAVCGAFYALWATGAPLEINSLIGCILLLGVAAKNSILLVDRIQEGLAEGQDLKTAILAAGRIRLRPIMMTTFALIAGMLPVAIPLEEAARSRAGMAIAVIGGLITSTLLTLVVVPAAYEYILRFQTWVSGRLRPHVTASPRSEGGS